MTVEKHKSERSEQANTPIGRGAYLWVFHRRTKRANGAPLDKPHNSMTFILPKLNADPAQCANYNFLIGLVMQAATKKWGSWPAGGYLPIQDGDSPYKPPVPKPGQAPMTPEQIAVNEAKQAWRKGHWVIEATANYFNPEKPTVDMPPKVAVFVNNQVTEIPAETVNGKRMFKSGDYCIASIQAYTFQNEKWGVNFGFEGVVFVGEGEAIGSSGPRSASAMFAGVAPQLPPGVKPPGSTATSAPLPNPTHPYAPGGVGNPPPPGTMPQPPAPPQHAAPAYQNPVPPAPPAAPMPPAPPPPGAPAPGGFPVPGR